MDQTLTVIVPTIGRRSLEDCLDSFAEDLRLGDAVIVAFDGDYNDELDGLTQQFSEDFSSPSWTYLWGSHLGCWGHLACNKALSHVKTTHVWRIDDDDVACDGAIDVIKDGIADYPQSVLIYKMFFGKGHPASGITLWREPQARMGSIGTPMVVAPVCDARYGERYEGDFDYLTAVIEEFGEPVWMEDVIAEIRPVPLEEI